MKPIIIYVDDEPRNLTVFEASVPEEWTLKCYDNAVEALKTIKEVNPWIIISDQKMPNMTGLEFLEIASQLVPDAVRIVVTGQTEEQTIIQLVRRAKIFDYFTKPWDTETLLCQLKKAIDYYSMVIERRDAIAQLTKKNQQLEDANKREIELRNEISAWTPAPILWGIKERNLQFPAKKDLIGVTYDIVGSSALHGTMVQERSVKSHVLRLFTQCLMKMGGFKESSSGDSVYGHFGAIPYPTDPYEAAMVTAQEFRVLLRGFSRMHHVQVECGVALHYAPNTLIQLHEIRTDSPDGPVVQKWIDTDSVHIDLLHRMEKLVHELPGTNIIMSSEFLKRLQSVPQAIVPVGFVLLKGQKNPIDLHILPSDLVDKKKLDEFRSKFLDTKQLAA